MKKISIATLCAIIVLLIFLIYIQNSHSVGKTNLSLATSNIIQVQMALLAYGKTYGVYPPTLNSISQDLLKNIDVENIVYTASNCKFSKTKTLRLFYEKRQKQYGDTTGFFDAYSDAVRFRALKTNQETSDPLLLNDFK